MPLLRFPADRAVLLDETGPSARYYLHPEYVRTELLQPSNRRTTCPFKGLASYWPAERPTMIWCGATRRPSLPRRGSAGLMCFYNERAGLTIDGERPAEPGDALLAVSPVPGAARMTLCPEHRDSRDCSPSPAESAGQLCRKLARQNGRSGAARTAMPTGRHWRQIDRRFGVLVLTEARPRSVTSSRTTVIAAAGGRQ